MTKVKIDLEGNKPVYDVEPGALSASIERVNIKNMGVTGIRGIDESWDAYKERIANFEHSEEMRSLKKARLKALKESTRTPV